MKVLKYYRIGKLFYSLVCNNLLKPEEVIEGYYEGDNGVFSKSFLNNNPVWRNEIYKVFGIKTDGVF